MKKVYLSIVLLIIFAVNSMAQDELTQTIRGKITDLYTGLPIPNATVVWLKSNPLQGTMSDAEGNFWLKNVIVGRQGIKISFLGYETAIINNLIVSSGKELVIDIKLQEKVIEVDEIVVKGYRKDEVINDLAKVSARSFSIEETERYAGSWGDPSRMASNFAGVIKSSDQTNDIIIRGNSPSGLLWRVEGINIPNPNHFGALGSTGGPVSMLNNNVLANSDFMTGAFPAGYGNALSGCFDLNMRNGNNEQYEFLGMIGFGGFEFGAEGPIPGTKKGSVIANYRYSTLGVLDLLGLDMGVGAVPHYQDVSFKINLPKKNKGKISIFGIGGLSNIHFDTREETNYSDLTDFTSDMGVIGITNTDYLNTNSAKAASLRTTLAISGTRSESDYTGFVYDTTDIKAQASSSEIKYSISSEYRKKFNSKNNINVGIIYDYISMNHIDSFYTRENGFYINGLNIDNNMSLLQTYFNWQHRFTDKLAFVGGLHSQYLPMNNDFSIEPRVSMKWKFANKQSVSLGYGLHSQIQDRGIYFMETLVDSLNMTYKRTNKNLNFSKSHHLVAGYDVALTPNIRMKIEGYYQYLFDIPIEKKSSYYSLLNTGSSFEGGFKDSLVNKGTGRNIGLDITLERFLSNNFYYLATISLFDAKYTGSDNIERNSYFNGNYVMNVLGGYEIKIKEKNALTFDIKATWAGGMRKIEIKREESIEKQESVYDNENAYQNRNKDYMRIDFRIGFKQNAKKFSQELAIDIQNITAHKNFFQEYFDREDNEIKEIPQMSFMPMVFWRINF